MFVKLFGKTIDVKDAHAINTKSPIDVTPEPISTDVRELHPLNADPPINFTLSGMTIDVKGHPANASPPIVSRFVPSVMDVNDKQ
jgi:hypothetical protein